MERIEGADTCPFCDGEPEYYKECSFGSPRAMYISRDYITIRCSKCHSQLESVTMPDFADCSNYRVEDFRRDPTLRPKVNKIHAQRVADTKSNLLVKWNKRKNQCVQN